MTRGPHERQLCVYCALAFFGPPCVLVRDEWGEGEDFHGAYWAHLDCYDRMNRNELWHFELNRRIYGQTVKP